MSYNAVWLASLPLRERSRILRRLSASEQLSLLFTWEFWARPEQIAPVGLWAIWLILAGRGWGKSRTGNEWVRREVEAGRASRVALVAPTAADARDVIVEGESGLLAISRPDFRPVYEPSKRRVTWPNGALGFLYSADEPERLRGPQHDLAYLDEFASWRFVAEAYDNLQFGLRLGQFPRQVITTTPKPIKLIRELLKDEHAVVTRGSTYENRANLAPSFFRTIVGKYEGTRIGRQELHAEVLEDAEGALWRREEMIEAQRVRSAPEFARVVVAVDPATTSAESSNETGIIVAGLSAAGHAYVLADRTIKASPQAWALAAINAYREFEADRVVAETNQGGEMVRTILRSIDASVSYKGVHASRGKQTRAEPVAALYEQGKVHHVGAFPQLEDQMCQWEPGSPSPDRLDALVWALSELCLKTVVTSILVD